MTTHQQPFEPMISKEKQRLLAGRSLSTVFKNSPIPESIYIVVRAPTPIPPPLKRDREGSETDLSYAKHSKLTILAPSTIGDSAEYKNPQKDPKMKILDDRPTQDEDIAPIAPLYEGFGNFEDIVQGYTDVLGLDKVVIGNLEEAVDSFADSMQGFFESEMERREVLLPALNNIFNARLDGHSAPLMASSIWDVNTDCHSNGAHGAIEIIVQLKNEFTGILALPDVEMLSCVAHSNILAMVLPGNP